jgi:hypothetical protein
VSLMGGYAAPLLSRLLSASLRSLALGQGVQDRAVVFALWADVPGL